VIKLPCGCVRHEGYGHVNTKLCAAHGHAHFHQPDPRRPIAGEQAPINRDLVEPDNLDLIGG
jgi:hypothetical protein